LKDDEVELLRKALENAQGSFEQVFVEEKNEKKMI
jgi:hypothetical protein